MIWHGFFSSLPWQDLVPDQDHTVVTAGFGSLGDLQTRVSKSDFSTASKTPDGSFVVAYMPTERTITVNMASLKAPAIAKWFDPSNGVYTTISGGTLCEQRNAGVYAPRKESRRRWRLGAAACSYQGEMNGTEESAVARRAKTAIALPRMTFAQHCFSKEFRIVRKNRIA